MSFFPPAPEMDLPINYDKASPLYRRLAREEYTKRQGGDCKHCGESLGGPPIFSVRDAHINYSLFPQGFFNNPVHLHHNRQTSMTIGAVHARCNAYLWQYKGE